MIPFRLQAVGYDQVPVRTGWLVAAFVSGPLCYEVSVANSALVDRPHRW